MNSEKIIIRFTENSDAEKLAEYVANIFKENLDTIFKRNAKPTVEEQKAFIERMSTAENSFLLIAEYEHQIVGMLDFHVFKVPQKAHGGSFGMSVLKDFRGMGIGKELLKHMIAVLQNAGKIQRIELQVFSNNANAIKLYESLGFEHEGRQRRAVQINNEFYDILFMAKFLKAF
ncbi:MAG: GNAT family N-acetyltransferase [Bacteroidota bacterium]